MASRVTFSVSLTETSKCLSQREESHRDDEVEDPVGEGRDSTARTTSPQRINLRVDRPGHRSHS